MNFKKVLSLILVVLTCITAVSTVSFTASAATKQEVYLIDLPRSNEPNKSGWGHSAKNYLNGWFTKENDTVTVKAIGDYEGQSCYCIEPGVSLYSGDTLSKEAEDFWDKYPSKYNKTISPDTIKIFIGRIMQYGWTGNNSVDWISTNAKRANECAQYFATQLLIWETVVGERDDNFDKIDASKQGKNNVKEVIQNNHPLKDKILNHYKSIEEKVKSHTVVPSFSSKNSSNAKTIELKWNGTDYSTTLTDNNNVLSAYTFSGSGLKFSKSGNKLTVTADKAPTSAVKITVSKNSSKRKAVITWTDEIIEPKSGQLQDIVTYGEAVNDPVTAYFKVNVSYGSAKIIKTSEDGKVDGIAFRIQGDGVDKTVKTANGGQIQIDNLNPGVYTVTEITDNNYEPQEVRRVTVVSGQTATVTFSNKLKRGNLTVTKTSEDGFNEGIKFHLYGKSISGIEVDEYAVTDKSGKAYFKDVLIGSNYTLEEAETDIRYVVPENQTADIEWNKVTNKAFNNTLKKWQLTVTKTDAETGTQQGDASLAGAVYGIYKGNQLVDTYTTDTNGQFTTKVYVCGNDWSLREIKASEGYLLNTESLHIGAEAKLYKAEYNLAAPLNALETVQKGNIAIIKHTDDGETKIETPESGATFEIYLKSAGSYTASEEDERDIIVCDENGFGQTKDMPYGVYTVHQTVGLEGRELMKDFDVFIAQNGQTYRYLINNANFESYIKVVKVDAESGKTIPYAGAGFQIYDPTGNLVTMSFTYPTPTTIDTFYTDANGCLVTPEKLEYGKGYSLVEVQAPYGYVLDSTPVYFDVTQDNATEESGVTVIKVDKPNMAQKGTITVEKTGEVFYGVSVSGSEDTEVIYQPIYEIAGLSGAVYEIRAAEDIITPDGTVRFTKGEVVDTVTTGEDGLAKSRELYLGKYEVKEIKAPYGMVLNDEIHTAELVYAGQNVSVTETATSFVNERQKVEIRLKKTLETSDLFGIGQNGELKNINFGLFAAEELVSASGTSIPADGLIEIVTLDESGSGTVKTDLPMGGYYVKELATDEHYILSDTKYPVTFEYAGQENAKVQLAVNDGEAIENHLIYGSVSGKKVDENGEPLGGALIGLFKYNDTEFTKENALMTVTSKEDGSFSFEQIPFGIWYVREIEQPTGFVLNETVYEVNIAENEQVVEIEIVNEFVRGNITLTKVDADFPDNKLTGATFEVYQDNNADGKPDDSDTLIGTLTESEAGIYVMKDLLYGHYLVKETKAPDVFLLDTGIYPVFIETDGMTYSVENKAGVGFINEAMKGNLKIVKTSSDGKVEGFSFRITGANGYDVTLKTDENGEIFIEGLRIGEYTVSEVADEVSAPYSRPADKKANVMTDSTTIVEMHNVVIDTPKTGDNSKLGLWLALLGASAAGIGVTVYAGVRKKKKEDAQ